MLHNSGGMGVDEKKVWVIFEKHISMKICKIERCGVGYGNYVYIVSGEMERYVVRCSEEENAYADTIYWLKRLMKAGIPVPRVVAEGKYLDYWYVILSYLEGEDLGIVYPALSDEEKRGIAREVVRIQNVVAALELEDLDGQWSWDSFIRDMLERAKERIVMNGYFDADKVRQLWEMREMLRDYFRQIKPVAYLDDISTKNLLIEKGKVSGIIDVDWIGVGDKLSYVAMTNVALLNMEYDTDYVEYLLDEMKINRTERKAYIYYSLLYCVDFMGERGMQFGDKRVDVNEEIIGRLNRIFDRLMVEWERLD